MVMHRLLSKNLWQPPSFLVLLVLATPSLHSQVQTQPSGQKPEEPNKTIRAHNLLVPTDVLVFDREGRFASDLRGNQFELLVNGKAQPISCFELVTAGSSEEERQWAEAQGIQAAESPRATRSNHVGGRTFFFFLDDWHMSADSVRRVREALLRFIDSAMDIRDRAAIVAATRQIGFMQQLSNDKSVLRTAAEQMTFIQPQLEDNQRPVMNEAQAIAIEQNDSSVLASFVDATLAENHQTGKAARQGAEQIVRRRASALTKKSINVTEGMLFSLSDLLRSHADLPGRKLVFVLSDGFVLKCGPSDATERLLEMTEAAARAGIAIYALDTGGSEVGRGDALSKPAHEPAGIRPISTSGEPLLPPDGPRVLAAATGGRFLGYTGALDDAVRKVLAETSRYYLLGWHIDPIMLQSGNSKSLRVSIKDHPDFAVRLRQTSIDLSQYLGQEQEPPKDLGLYELLKAIRSPNPHTALPTFLYAGYIYQPDKRAILQVLTQIAYETIVAAVAPNEETSIELLGAILKKNGATADFFQSSLSVPAYSATQKKENQADVSHSRSVALAPGVYQVRVAARDGKSGRTGSAYEWIEVPPFVPGKFCLSSIYLREQQVKEASLNKPDTGSLPEMPLSARRRFSALSQLSFYLYIYNAVHPPDSSPPGISVQVKIYSGDQAVVQSSWHPIKTQAGAGMEFIAYQAAISLKGLPAGSYSLEVTAMDQSNNTSATQRVSFWIQ
jgi:VWFA-related protein